MMARLAPRVHVKMAGVNPVADAIFALSLALLLAGFHRVGFRPSLLILAAVMMAAFLAGLYLSGPSRVVAFILIDLCTIFAVKVWHDRAHDRLVAFIAFAGICWSVLYMAVPYINYWAYASGVNCAAVMQLLIGGGMADDLGRRIDDWLRSLSPRWADALRSVAVF
jgi:hypothetical protein